MPDDVLSPIPNPVDTAKDGKASRPSAVRWNVAALLTLTACLLYLDRYAVGITAEQIRLDMRMTQTEMSWFISLFFWSYALAQVPAGWLSDRFGPRWILSAYILGWSLFTGLMGVATHVWMLLGLRFLCGCAQAGAYPVATGMVRVWFPVSRRGLASSLVALGGRSGALLAPVLTAFLMTRLQTGWQSVMIVYGLAGIVTALLFAWQCRDRPSQHVGCNLAERELIQQGDPLVAHPPAVEHVSLPWRAMLRSAGLWGSSLAQFFTNVGWLFVVTWLPRYLGQVHGVPLDEQALMSAVPVFTGIVGMFCGGWCADGMVRRLGLKWGRRVPVAVTRFAAGLGYLLCLILGVLIGPASDSRWLAWGIVACLSLVTFAGDLGVPPLWAYAQDVGGKFTASVMGWTNMFGNLGAALAPLVYNFVLGETPTQADWNNLFGVCTGVFFLAGVAALLLDSTHPLAATRPAKG